MNNYTPQPSDLFTFGLWTVGNPGRDPFGEPTRAVIDPNDTVRKLGRTRRLWRQLARQRFGALRLFGEPSAIASSRTFKKTLAETGMKVPMATTNLFSQPIFKDGAFTSSRPESARLTRVQKTMRAMDLGAEFGRETYVFWGGREGSEVDAAKNPLDTLEMVPRSAQLPQRLSDGAGLRLQTRARTQAQRAARRYLSRHDGPRAGLHRNAGSSGKRRRQPGIRARHDRGSELHAQHRAGALTRENCSTSTSTARSRAASIRICALARKT